MYEKILTMVRVACGDGFQEHQNTLKVGFFTASKGFTQNFVVSFFSKKLLT
jgi:hypothetical protein